MIWEEIWNINIWEQMNMMGMSTILPMMGMYINLRTVKGKVGFALYRLGIELSIK